MSKLFLLMALAFFAAGILISSTGCQSPSGGSGSFGSSDGHAGHSH